MAASDAASTAVVAVINQTVNACTAGLHNPTPVQQISGGEYLISETNNGAIITTVANAGGTAVATQDYTRPVTYCLNLISLIGTLCNSHYFPTFACTSAPLRVEIQLVDQLYKCLNISGVTVGTAVSYPSLHVASNFLSNVEYIASFIELGDGAICGTVGLLVCSFMGGSTVFGCAVVALQRSGKTSLTRDSDFFQIPYLHLQWKESYLF